MAGENVLPDARWINALRFKRRNFIPVKAIIAHHRGRITEQENRMNKFHCMNRARAAASCLLIGLIAGAAANAGDNATDGELLESCREEVWRVTVKANGGNPKSSMLPRYHKRTVLVCGEKVFAELQRRASSEASGSRTDGGA